MAVTTTRADQYRQLARDCHFLGPKPPARGWLSGDGSYPQAVSPLLRGCLRRVETMSKRNGQAKLTSATVEATRNAKERRGIVTALAIQYGVSHSMISMIRAGKRWTEDPTTEERFKPDLYAMHGS